MNRRQALLSRRVVRFCKKPSFVAIKDTIPEDTPVDAMIPIMKADGPSLIDLTGYPEQSDHRPSRYPQRRLGRNRAGARTRGASEKHIDLTCQEETLDDGTKELGIISEATLSPNAMMLKRRTAESVKEEEAQPTHPKLSYTYRNQSPSRADVGTGPREDRVETDEDRGKGSDRREGSHHQGNGSRRAWKRLFIDKSAMEATQATSEERNQDFLSAFSYEFKKHRKDKDDDHSDIVVLDDILPSSQSHPTTSAQLTVASPFHETFRSTTREALSPIPTIAPEVRRADMTHATQLHLQKQAARIDSIRQRARELQQRRRMRPTPEWRPAPLVDFATQDLQGQKTDTNVDDAQYRWLSPTGRKALKFRKTRKATEDTSLRHQELERAKNIEEQGSQEVLGTDGKDAIVEVESMVSNESEKAAHKLEGTGQTAIDCPDATGTTPDDGSEQGLFQPNSNIASKEIVSSNEGSSKRTLDSACLDSSAVEVRGLDTGVLRSEPIETQPPSQKPNPTFSDKCSSVAEGDVSSPQSQSSKDAKNHFASKLTINTNLSKDCETHLISSDESREQLLDRAEQQGRKLSTAQGKIATCQYISPVSDTDASQARIVSPDCLEKTDTLSQVHLELNYSLSDPDEPTMTSKEKKYQWKPQRESGQETQEAAEESREPEQSQYERNDGLASPLGCQSLENTDPDHDCGREGSRDDENNPYDRFDDLDLPQCLTESTRHGLDAIDADSPAMGSKGECPQISILNVQSSPSLKGSPRNKMEDALLDEQSYSSWSIKPKVSFPSSVDAIDKPKDNFEPVEFNSLPPEHDIDDIQEVNTNDLMTIMEEATSIIVSENAFTQSSVQEWDRNVDDNERFFPDEEYHQTRRAVFDFHEGTSDNESPTLPTHDQVRRSRFTSPLTSPKSTKSTDTSTSGDNAIESDFYRVGSFRPIVPEATEKGKEIKVAWTWEQLTNQENVPSFIASRGKFHFFQAEITASSAL